MNNQASMKKQSTSNLSEKEREARVEKRAPESRQCEERKSRIKGKYGEEI